MVDSISIEQRSDGLYLKIANVDPSQARQRKHDFLNAIQSLKTASEMILNGYSFDGDGGAIRRKALHDAVTCLVSESSLIETYLQAATNHLTKE